MSDSDSSTSIATSSSKQKQSSVLSTPCNDSNSACELDASLRAELGRAGGLCSAVERASALSLPESRVASALTDLAARDPALSVAPFVVFVRARFLKFVVSPCFFLLLFVCFFGFFLGVLSFILFVSFFFKKKN